MALGPATYANPQCSVCHGQGRYRDSAYETVFHTCECVAFGEARAARLEREARQRNAAPAAAAQPVVPQLPLSEPVRGTPRPVAVPPARQPINVPSSRRKKAWVLAGISVVIIAAAVTTLVVWPREADPNLNTLRVGDCVHVLSDSDPNNPDAGHDLVSADRIEPATCLSASDPTTGATGEVFDIEDVAPPVYAAGLLSTGICQNVPSDTGSSSYTVRVYAPTLKLWNDGFHRVVCVAQNFTKGFPIPGVAAGSSS